MAQVLSRSVFTNKQLDEAIKLAQRQLNNYRSLGLVNMVELTQNRLTFLKQQRMLPPEKRTKPSDAMKE